MVGDEDGFVLEPSFNSKLLVDVTETPRTIEIVGQELIREQAAQSIQEALSYVPGVFAGPFGVDSRLDDVQVRGLDPLRFQDGFQSHVGFYNTTRPDVFTVESVEVIKGPASVLYGQGAIGGIVNVNTKLPKAVASRELNLQYGSHDRKQVGIDLTGPLDEEGKWLYRLVSVMRESGTQVDYVNDDETLFMPSLAWRPNDDTSWTILGNLQDTEAGSTLQFLPLNDPLLAGIDIDSSTFAGEPDWDRYNTKQTAISQFFNHRISDSLTVAVNAKYSEGEADYAYHQTVPPSVAPTLGFPALPSGFLHRLGYLSQASSDTFAANAIGKLESESGSVSHNIQFGVDYFDATTDDNRPTVLPGLRGFFVTGTFIDIRNPTFSGAPVEPPATDASEFLFDQVGFFVGDVISFDNWNISLGARQDWVDEAFRNNSAPESSNSEVSLDFGVMYKFDNGLSPYYSYAESFQANGYDPINEVIFDPREGVQHELGVKYQSAESGLLVTGAVFDIDESNRLQGTINPVPIDAEYTGAELGVQQSWEDYLLRLSLTYLDAKQTQAATELFVSKVPKRQASVWAGYEPDDGPLESFKAGLGFRYADKTYSNSNAFLSDDYALFDAMLGYKLGNLDVQLNVKNLFDEEYIAASEDGLIPGVYFGVRRSVVLTGSYGF